MSWPEVDRYKEQKAHELVLTGAAIDERLRLDVDQIDARIFSLTSLNFLEISSSVLAKLPPGAFDNLPNLINLVLRNNQLTEVPFSIGCLQKLRFLDVSSNRLTTVPDAVNQCVELTSLNLRGNQLATLPSLGQGKLGKLSVLDVSNNQLSEFPEDLTCLSLGGLSELHAQNNAMTGVPESIKNLHALKVINMENNAVTRIPPELSLCVKLKELNFKGNRLEDRRLSKMVETSCKTSSIVEYLHKLLPKTGGGGGGKSSGKAVAGSARKKAKARSKSRGARSRSQSPAVKPTTHSILVQPPLDVEERRVEITAGALEVRPYILCCVVEDVNLAQTNNLFKRFLAAQTKLHDSVCQKRLASTIATHDNDKIKYPLLYDARHEKTLMIQPLMRSERETAESLKSRLLAEAEETRKKTKRNAFTGIHKYLDLVRNKDIFACLVANAGSEGEQVISFPPITNSDVSKISPTTTSIFVEVTSSTSLDAAKRTMDALIKEMLLLGLTQGSYDNVLADAADSQADGLTASMREMSVEGKSLTLKVRQVRVVDQATASLRTVYPSNVDLLQLDGIDVERSE